MLHGQGGGVGDADQAYAAAEGSADREKAMKHSALDDLDGRNQQYHDRDLFVSTAPRTLFHASSPTEHGRDLTSAQQPHTYHPLLHPRLSSFTRLLLLSIWDVLLIAILAAHIVTYFVSLPTALALCSLPRVLAHPDIKYLVIDRSLTVRNACLGLNMDIHVAGGFAVFLALMLGTLHLAALAVRFWKCVAFKRAGVVSRCADQEEKADVEGVGKRASEVAGVSLTSRTAVSISGEERSTGIEFVDWNAERAEQMARRRAARTDESETSKVGSKWSETVLECLIDA